MVLQQTNTEAVIVGGGLAGLTAACYLAQAGVGVRLFEKGAELGGRASTQTFDDYRFNRGIHALYCGGAAEEVLNDLKIPYSGHKPTAKIRALRQGKLHIAPYDAFTLLSTDLLSIADKLEFIRVFSSLAKMNPHEYAYMSVQEWLDRNVRQPRLRQFLAANARTLVYSAALDFVSAEVFVLKTQLALRHPVLYIDGGWRTLADGLRKRAEQSGAQIESGVRVESVEYADGQVHGVHLRDGSVVPASAVVIATAPRDAVRLVDGGAYEPLRQIVNSIIPAQVASLDVALKRLPNSDNTIVQDIDRPLFMSTQSLYSRVAPRGGALIYTFKQLDPRFPTNPHEDERDLETLLDTAQPGWRDVLVKRQFLPRIDAIGMLPTASGGGYAGRPAPEVPGISNLYLAGDWIGEGFLSDASFGSARRIAHTVLRSGADTMTGQRLLLTIKA